MESLLRFGRYFRSPLVACGTYNTLTNPCPSFTDLDTVQLSFYHFFGTKLALVSNARRILSPGTFWAELSLKAVPEEIPQVESSTVSSESLVDSFSALTVPVVAALTANIDKLLLEAKGVVPVVLNCDFSSSDIDKVMLEEQGWTAAGSAAGEGFTCSVYRKEFGVLPPVYVICGDLDISVDTFHSLASDVDFRHRWDDQFHQVTVEPTLGEARLLNWIVKWPWPLAPRAYRYVLTSHVLDPYTKLVMAASLATPSNKERCPFGSVPVREYFGITAARQHSVSSSRSRFCVFHFDDPCLPGRMPTWLERYVAQSLLPAFPRKIIAGAKLDLSRKNS